MTNVALPPGAAAPAPLPSGPPPPPKPRSKDVPVSWLIGALVVMLVMGGAAYVFYTKEFGKAAKPAYPAHWDSRVEPFARIAERQRGLYFAHPVAVRFLSGSAFEKTVTTDDADMSKKDRKELEDYTGFLRAIGLVSGDVDLFKASNEASGAGVLAYYSFEDQRITIKGNSVTPAVRATLVHELTHALQDQHFQVGARIAKLAKDDSSDSAQSVFRAIVEGDAERVADRYRRSLPPAQRKRLAAAEDADQKDGSDRLGDVPNFVVLSMGAPYVLGQSLVEVAATRGGTKRVDELLRKPPTHENVLLDPAIALSGSTRATHVARPKLDSGEKRLESGEFGATSWFLMLSERLPAKTALAAADGWGGDQYVAYRRDDTSCARAAFSGRASADSTRMYGALRQWIARTPGSKATVTQSGNVVTFASCDPGTSAKALPDLPLDTLGIVNLRAQLLDQFLHAKATLPRSQCISHALVQQLSTAQLTDQRLASSPATQDRIRRIAGTCA